MLVSFSVANFRSFGEEVTLNMVASKRVADHPNHRISIPKSDKELVRAAVIYGANAAGKSNLIKAMRLAQSWVGGERTQVAQKFRFDDVYSSKPSTFEFRFLIGERIFVYGFDVDGMQIQEEWLSFLHVSAEIDIFTRNSAGSTSVNGKASKFFENDDPKMFETLEALILLPLRPFQLFLNRVSGIPSDAQGPMLASIVRWLTQDLVILTADHRSRDILDRLEKDEQFRAFCNSFLSGIGTGVSGLHVALDDRDADEVESRFITDLSNRGVETGAVLRAPHSDVRPDPKNPGRIIIRTLVSEHQSSNPQASYLPFIEESDGTQQLLHLMPVICPSETESKVVVIDELDRSLHPLICWMFISFFSESSPNARRQLIVTTHEVHLLNQSLLRRDEFWFMEKNEHQQSMLTSLSDFKIRNDLQIEKGYLDGRFGAIPSTTGIAALQEMIECERRRESVGAQEKTPA